jgi:hypothetical protein
MFHLQLSVECEGHHASFKPLWLCRLTILHVQLALVLDNICRQLVARLAL